MSAVPALSSRPGAYQKLYLDFNGDYTANWGSYHPNTTPAYDTDGNPSSFSSGEISNIQQIWARVAEKYSPFNIDVTTVDPGSYGDKQAFRIVIGGSGGWAGGGSGGITWINSYNNVMPNTGYVFSANLAGGTPQYVGDAIAHEAGHGFGLNHQSSYSGTTLTAAYNKGNSATAPLMGNSYYAARGTWWYGQTESNSNTYQDDLAVLGNSIGYRSDDVGNWINSASNLSLSGTYASASGVIERTTDSDFFSFSTGGGNVSFAANPSSYGGMLDLQLSLYNSSGSLIANANTASLGENLSAYLSAGTYYVAVSSKGNYGDIGQYSLSGTIGSVGGGSNGGGTTAAPYTPSNVSANSSSTSQVSLSWIDNSSNETGFKIERMTDGGTWAQVATVGANVTAYVDGGLSAYTNYAYRIRATNGAGDSAYSNTVWVTTRSSGTTTTPTTPPTNSTGGSVPSGTKLSGTPIGTAGSWSNQGNVFTNALDGNINTFFDSNVRDYATVGYDLGAGNARVITAVRYAPRSGQAGRMVGGMFQGSNDGVNWSTLYTVTSQPAEGQFTSALVGGSTAFRYVRYQAPAGSSGNVAEVEFYSTGGAVTNPGGGGNGGTSTNMPSGFQVRGTAIGTAGSWNNQGSTFYKVFDGSLDTYFDAPDSQAWVGIDFGAKQYVASARFAPRSNQPGRMVGGQFQVSNDGYSWTTVATITSQPAVGQYTTINFGTAGSYRYVRYLSPQGGFGNIAEFQVFSGTAASADPVVITAPPEGEETEAHATPIFCASPIPSDLFGSDAGM